MTAETERETAVRRRPRDRKQQIVTAAGTLFHHHGYGNVGMGDIAGAVGITPGAIYRHFASKQEILRHAVDQVVDGGLVSVVTSHEGDLAQLVAALTESLRLRRGLGVLWHRESRHLDADHLAAMEGRLEGLLERMTDELAALRPELGRSEAYLLTRFVVSALTSPSYHGAEVPAEDEAHLLQRCALAVAATPVDTASATGSDAPARPPGLAPLSRREGLVAAAARLFFEQGYQATTMEDVGAALNVSGAAVYKYFASKSELLNATVARASEPLQLGLARALSSATTTDEALLLALDAYIDFATVHHHLVGILISEVTNLPADLRHIVRRQQADYVAEWVRLVRGSRPELDEARARYLVHAVLTIVNDATRLDELRAYPDLGAHLRRVGRRLLAVEL